MRKDLPELQRRVSKKEASISEEPEKHGIHQNINQKMNLKSGMSYDLRVKKKTSKTKLPGFES